MPYTLMIADDDAVIRRGLASLVPWTELGFEVIGVYDDGKPLLRALESAMPDVVLTDIRMREVSGLDIAQFVCERKLPVHVVILSGYQEFEYAQQGIRYGVQEYLCKPVSIDHIRNTFLGIYRELNQKKPSLINRDSLLRMQRSFPKVWTPFFWKKLMQDFWKRRRLLASAYSCMVILMRCLRGARGYCICVARCRNRLFLLGQSIWLKKIAFFILWNEQTML